MTSFQMNLARAMGVYSPPDPYNVAMGLTASGEVLGSKAWARALGVYVPPEPGVIEIPL